MKDEKLEAETRFIKEGNVIDQNARGESLLIIAVINFPPNRALADIRISERHAVVAQHISGLDEKYIVVEVRFNLAKAFIVSA